MHLALGIGTCTLVTIDLSVWRSQEATLLKHDLIFTYLVRQDRIRTYEASNYLGSCATHGFTDRPFDHFGTVSYWQERKDSNPR